MCSILRPVYTRGFQKGISDGQAISKLKSLLQIPQAFTHNGRRFQFKGFKSGKIEASGILKTKAIHEIDESVDKFET